MIQKMWRVEQEHDVIGILYYARVRQHQVAPNGKVQIIFRGGTAKSSSGEPSYVQGWLSRPGEGLSGLRQAEELALEPPRAIGVGPESLRIFNPDFWSGF